MRCLMLAGRIVGLIPREALLAAGDHYLRAQGKTTGVPEPERVQAAVLSLGLDDLGPFRPEEKIVEYRYFGVPEGLCTLTLSDFADELSSDSPAPGGGSVAALCGALAGSLTAMVAALTHGKKGMEGSRPAMEELGRRAQELKDWFVAAIDRDTDAFNAVMEAMRLPRKTEADRQAREEAMARANLVATQVPLEVLEHSVTALQLALQAAYDGNPNSVSDAGVAGACAATAARGASLNVRINLPGIHESNRAGVLARHDAALAAAEQLSETVASAVDAALAAE